MKNVLIIQPTKSTLSDLVKNNKNLCPQMFFHEEPAVLYIVCNWKQLNFLLVNTQASCGTLTKHHELVPKLLSETQSMHTIGVRF